MKETLKEAVSRKHFQMVADTLKAVQDPKKRAELANHHASIFAQANPRFDHKRFMAAANVTEAVESDVKWFEEANSYSVHHDGKVVHSTRYLDSAIKTAMQIHGTTGRKPTVMRQGKYTGQGVKVEYDAKMKKPGLAKEEVELNEKDQFAPVHLASIWTKGQGMKAYVWQRGEGGYDYDVQTHEKFPDGLKTKTDRHRMSHDKLAAHMKGQGYRLMGKMTEEFFVDPEFLVALAEVARRPGTSPNDVFWSKKSIDAFVKANPHKNVLIRPGSKVTKQQAADWGVKHTKKKGFKVESLAYELDEVAKWRTNPKAHTQTKPGDTDSSEDYDYYYDNPKSTGYKTPNVKGLPDSLPKFSVATIPLTKHSIASKGPRKGLPTTSFFSTKKNAIKNRLGTHTAPNLPESLAYEGEGTYTVHHGKTGEKVHTGLNKKAAMDAAVALHAKTGVKPTVYHRAVSGYGGHSYGKIKQEIPIEGTVMADKPNLTESERIAYKAAFKDALDEAARKVSVGDTVLVGTRKGYVSAKGGDHVDVLHDDEKAPKSYHHSKVAKYSKAAHKRARDHAHVMNATNPNSETYMSSSYEPEGRVIAEGETYMVGSKTFKDKATADKHSAMLRSGGPYMVGSKTFKDKAAADKHSASLRKESYEPKAAVPGTFNAPRSEFDSTPGYNVLGSEQIHGKTVKYVRMGSFFAPVVVAVDGEPWENAEGQPIKFAGQQAARDEMWAKLNPAMQAAFDAAQSGKGGHNENEVEDEKVFAPKAPGMEECVEVDAWDELVEEVVIEGVDHSKLSPEESSHIKKNAMPTKMIPRGIGTNIRQVPVNHATVTLPYSSDEHRQMADGIAKKLGLKKYFRGKRERKADGASKHNTNKANARAVALYSR